MPRQLLGVGDPTASAGAGIDFALMVRMGSAGGPLDIGARAGARIDEFPGLQLRESRFVERQPLRLHDGAGVPVEVKPVQIVAGLLRRPRFDARRINVFDSQDQAAAPAAHGQPGNQIGAGVADVLGSGG